MLRVHLEGNEVLDWAFELWDAEYQCRIKKKVKRLNLVGSKVYIIRAVSEECGSGKRRRVDDGVFADEDLHHAIPEEGFTADPMAPVEVNPIRSSRVSGVTGESDEDPLRSILVSKEVMDQYMLHGEKLKRDLRDFDLDDHK